MVTAASKISAASLAMAIAAYYTEQLLRIPLAGNALTAQLCRVGGAILVGMAVLGITAHLLRIDEFRQLMRRPSATG
jgi:hypothetical protein